MTLGSNLDTLDLLRSSASVLSPGVGESSAGWGKGSVIPNVALIVSERVSHQGLRTQTVIRPVVRPYDPGPHRLALGDGDLSQGFCECLPALDAILAFTVAWVETLCWPGP